MPRQKKDFVPISLKLKKELYLSLEIYCSRTYLSKTAAIEKALQEMFQREKDASDE